jgi:hypothetical protein
MSRFHPADKLYFAVFFGALLTFALLALLGWIP